MGYDQNSILPPNTVLGVPDDSHGNESVAFNAIEHLDSLFIKTKAKLAASTYIEYPVGLQYLISNFVQSIADYPVRVQYLLYDGGDLTIQFEMIRQRGEVHVWRAIDRLKVEARVTCIGCGGSARRSIRGDKFIVICKSCQDAEYKKGGTGTWLDRY